MLRKAAICCWNINHRARRLQVTADIKQRNGGALQASLPFMLPCRVGVVGGGGGSGSNGSKGGGRGGNSDGDGSGTRHDSSGYSSGGGGMEGDG